VLAGVSLLVGLIHFTVCPEHFREATLFGLFFLVVAVLQLTWAGLILSRPSRALLRTGAVGNAAVLAVWLASRTAGLPVGPGSRRPEAIGLADLLASLLEVTVVIGALSLSSEVTGGQSWTHRLRRWLPAGSPLPDEVWAQRHRWILVLLTAHVPALFLFAVVRHESLLYAATAAALVAAFPGLAVVVHQHRRLTTITAAMGLLTCSAVLVRLSGGMIEMHFHYFVMVGVITLYQDWWPFLIAIGYVVLQHGLAGAIDPTSVYNHPEAIRHPWQWAAVHGLFILGMSSTGIASWRLNESFLEGVLERQEKLTEAQQVGRLGSWERNLVTSEATWSDEFYRLMDMVPGARTPSFADFLNRVHPADREDVDSGITRTREQGVPYVADFRILLQDGSQRWLHCRAQCTLMVDGRPVVVSGTAQEITERKDAEAELRETLSLLSATLDATADGILVVDAEGKITSFNHKFVEIWRLPDDILASRNDDDALAFVLGQVTDPEGFLGKVRELYAQPEADSQDVIEFRDGRTCERYSTPQRVGGVAVGRVWSFRDVTERKRLEGELAHQAFHDPLTNLANQALFRDRVDHALVRAGRKGDRLAVLFLDLDDFKTVNDSLGHTAGDQLLIAVSDRIRDCLRVTDTAARLGGDEFAVLVEDAGDEAEVVAVAERLITAMQVPFEPGGREMFVSASIGIAFDRSGATSDHLLRNADLAMYTAKRQGKARFAVYQAAMHTAAVDRLEIEADLRRGLARHELVVEYQPIVSLASSAVVGVEALVRWQHPERGLLPPSAFIPLAEETGLVREVGRQVLLEATSQTRRWQLAFPHSALRSVSVNVSTRQLHHDDLMEHVGQALAQSGLPADSLVLEITETAMMNDTEATIRKLRALKSVGIRLAVDDFGTGYSSLSYLQRFPVDILKIDQAFVAAITSSLTDSSLARAIVSLAHTLNLEAVAEGVENETQVDALSRLGCQLAQGFYFARPLSAHAMTGLLAGSRLGQPLVYR
jgi:diguanylate cyclase (GGDEF)-like protein